jgi:hypothetical protein
MSGSMQAVEIPPLTNEIAITTQTVDYKVLTNGFWCRCKWLKFLGLRRKQAIFDAFSAFKLLKFRPL